MQFGLFSHIPWPEGADQGQILAETIEQVQHGEALGFESAWFAEHHFFPLRPGLGVAVDSGADGSPHRDHPARHRYSRAALASPHPAGGRDRDLRFTQRRAPRCRPRARQRRLRVQWLRGRPGREPGTLSGNDPHYGRSVDQAQLFV